MAMLHAQLMRLTGVPIPRDQMAKQHIYSGDFVIDVASGSRRLRLFHIWLNAYHPIELYDPTLVRAKGGWQVWRGYERAGEQGVVQEWFVRTSEHD